MTAADTLRAAVEMLADTESYLSALHGSVARHDHLGANLTCAGCQLRDRVTPALAVARQLLGTGEQADAVATVCGCDPAPHREADGTYSHWAGCPVADAEQADTETAAYPPQHRWRLETHDPLANEWNQSTAYPDRADALARHQLREERFATWKDGTPVQRRIVRTTTTYTVEPTPAATEEPTR